MHIWKVDKNLGRALLPPHLDKIQKNSYFFSVKASLRPQVNSSRQKKHSRRWVICKLLFELRSHGYVHDTVGFMVKNLSHENWAKFLPEWGYVWTSSTAQEDVDGRVIKGIVWSCDLPLLSWRFVKASPHKHKIVSSFYFLFPWVRLPLITL